MEWGKLYFSNSYHDIIVEKFKDVALYYKEIKGDYEMQKSLAFIWKFNDKVDIFFNVLRWGENRNESGAWDSSISGWRYQYICKCVFQRRYFLDDTKSNGRIIWLYNR